MFTKSALACTYIARANLYGPVNLGVGNVYFLFFYVNVSKSIIL